MIFIFFSLILRLVLTQATPDDLTAKLDAIAATPERIVLGSNLNILKKGGHLQGIQPYRYHDETYFYLSGSSSRYGYLATSTMKDVEKLHVIGKKPLKHAGGFQIHNNWLAVGIEDNELRNISEIHVYQLGDPLAKNLNIRAIIERTGDWERATAGAVAIIEWQSRLLLLVGDWSNRHIDFYHATLGGDQAPVDFQKTSEIEMATCSKQGWVDQIPWPYQNINLVKYHDQLLLFGFSSGEDDVNLVDVYQLEQPFSDTPILTKIYTKSFPKTRETRFGWGAGVHFDNENFIFYSCGENIEDQVVISQYSSR